MRLWVFALAGLFLLSLLLPIGSVVADPDPPPTYCTIELDPETGAVPQTVAHDMFLGCQKGPWHWILQVEMWEDTDANGRYSAYYDTMLGIFYEDDVYQRGALVEYNNPVLGSILISNGTPDFYVYRLRVASHGAADHSGDSNYQYATPLTVFINAGAINPDYVIAILYPDQPPATIQIQNGTSSKSIDAWVTNVGNKDLNEVNLTLLNATDAVADTAVVQSVSITGINQKSALMTFAVPRLVGSYAYKLRGNYTNETSGPTDDVIRWYNFTVQVVAEILESDFIIGSVSIFQNPISKGSITILRVRVENTGDLEIRLGVWTNYDADALLIVPDIEITIPALNLSEVRDILFYVRGLTEGDHTITVRASLVDASGDLITTDGYKERSVILSIVSVPEGTTLSPDDLGPNDGILQAKIDSLGRFPSVRVYFVIWETADQTTAVQVPEHGEVVSFVSNYRVYVNFLTESTNYTVSFRLKYAGGEAEGGDIQFTTPGAYSNPLTGLRNTFAIALSLDSITMGIILGVGALFIIMMLFTMIIRDPIILIFPGMGAIAFNVAVGWWPQWTLIVLALLLAVLVGKALPLAGGSED